MDKNTRKKMYKNALEIVKVVNDTDKIFRSMGVNLEFDDESTIIGRTMDVLFSNPKNIVCDALGLQLKQEDGHYRIARKTAANLDAHNLVLRIKLSVGCKRS